MKALTLFHTVLEGRTPKVDLNTLLKELTQDYSDDLLKDLSTDFNIYLEEYSRGVIIRKKDDAEALKYFNELKDKEFGYAQFLKKYGSVMRLEDHQIRSVMRFIELLKEYRIESSNELIELETDKIRWSGNRSQLENLITELIGHEFIQSNVVTDLVDQHFNLHGKNNTESGQPMKWLIDNQYLGYLYNTLIDELLIRPSKKRYQTLSNHFLNKNGKPIKPKSMASSVSQINKKRQDNIIQEIREILNRIKN